MRNSYSFFQPPHPMKRILSVLRPLAILAALAPAAFGAHAQAPQPPEIAARAYILLDVTANQVLAAKNIDAPGEQASLTKLMTAYLVFDALRAEKISLQQKLPVSERAWKMPGSRMFIGPTMQVPVEDLLKGMIVQSGHDAAMALAEGVGANESQKLLNWGSPALEAVKLFDAGQPVATPAVWKGRTSQLKIGHEEAIVMTVPAGSTGRITTRIARPDPLVAPYTKGQSIGPLQVMLGDQTLGEVPLVALEDVQEAGILGRAWDAIRLWIK